MIQAYCYWHTYSPRGDLLCARGIVSDDPVACPYSSDVDAAKECLDCMLAPRMGARYAKYSQAFKQIIKE